MSLNILIVDDSPMMRAFIRKVLDLTGIELGQFCEAGDGEAALRLLDQRWMDLVLSDINMPNMNGEEFVRRMKSDELLRTIPIIVVSTDSSRSRKGQMIALGADGYVAKPFLPEMLRDEIERVLGVAH